MPSPAKPTGGRVKGAPLVAMCETWAELRGRPELVDVISSLPPDSQALFDIEQTSLGILSTSWCSAIAVGHLVDGLFAKVSPSHQEDVLVDLARGTMNRTLRGVHKAAFRIVGSPELMRRRPQMFWSQQYDTGRVTISDLSANEQLHVYEDWPGHHPKMCEFSFHSAAVMLEFTGVAAPVQVEMRECAAHGAKRCAAVVRWGRSASQ